MEQYLILGIISSVSKQLVGNGEGPIIVGHLRANCRGTSITAKES